MHHGTPAADEALSARALAALVSQLTTGYPNPDGPDSLPVPLDPYIRRALERSVIGSVGRGTCGGSSPRNIPRSGTSLAATRYRRSR
jgi:hypothetical protein